MCYSFIVVEAVVEYSDIEAPQHYSIAVAASITTEEHVTVEQSSEEEGD